MNTLTNINHSALSSFVSFCFNDVYCELLINGSGLVISDDSINDELTEQLSVFKDYDTETTVFTFDDFEISCCNNEVEGKLI